jgi:hypothetical protein
VAIRPEKYALNGVAGAGAKKIILRKFQFFAQKSEGFGAGRLPALFVMRNALRFNSGEFGERDLGQSARFAGFGQPCSDKSWSSNSHRILSKKKQGG